MQIVFTVTLTYGKGQPDENEETPEPEDIEQFLIKGMADEGMPSADIEVEKH